MRDSYVPDKSVEEGIVKVIDSTRLGIGVKVGAEENRTRCTSPVLSPAVA